MLKTNAEILDVINDIEALKLNINIGYKVN